MGLLRTQEAPKGAHLKGGHLKMKFRSEIRTQHLGFALTFALDTSVLTPLSKTIPEGKRRLDKESASRRHRAPQNVMLRGPGLRSRGLGLPQEPSAIHAWFLEARSGVCAFEWRDAPHATCPFLDSPPHAMTDTGKQPSHHHRHLSSSASTRVRMRQSKDLHLSFRTSTPASVPYLWVHHLRRHVCRINSQNKFILTCNPLDDNKNF